jgi:hypothetical protein
MISGEDQRIQGDVSDWLSAELPADAAQIQVDVTHGEVTLAGTVDTSEARRRAKTPILAAIQPFCRISVSPGAAGRAVAGRWVQAATSPIPTIASSLLTIFGWGAKQGS